MNFRTLIRKINTGFNLINQGKFLKTIKNGETEWQLARRTTIWNKRLITQNPIIDRLSGGEIIELYPGDRVSELIYKRQFENDEQEFIRKYLRKGDVFVDVGSNLGLYTLIAAKCVGKGGKVFAFEPAEVSYRRLLKNVLLNRFSNANCFKLALSDKEEMRSLTFSLGEHAAWSSLAHPVAGNRFVKETVSCISWDKFVYEHELSGGVTLMKIDVEGWELLVLNGATKELSQPDSPELLIEFTDENALTAGLSCEVLYRKLENLGYRMYQVDTKKRLLIPERLRKNYPYMNLLATKREEFVMQRLKLDFA